MSGHGEKLTRSQESSIAALLSTQTVTSAAIDAKVNINTLTRWMRDDAGFQSAYRDARYQVLQRTIDGLVQCSTLAVRALTKRLQEDKVPIAVIRVALDFAFRGIELDNFAQRLEVLEKEMHHA